MTQEESRLPSSLAKCLCFFHGGTATSTKATHQQQHNIITSAIEQHRLRLTVTVSCSMVETAQCTMKLQSRSKCGEVHLSQPMVMICLSTSNIFRLVLVTGCSPCFVPPARQKNCSHTQGTKFALQQDCAATWKSEAHIVSGPSASRPK